jgi:hypothetical protein
MAGRRPRSLSVWFELSLTARSRTSPRTDFPKRCLRIWIGTFPGRKPGTLTLLPSSCSRPVNFSSISRASSWTLKARFKPSELVSVTCIGGSVLRTLVGVACCLLIVTRGHS